MYLGKKANELKRNLSRTYCVAPNISIINWIIGSDLLIGRFNDDRQNENQIAISIDWIGYFPVYLVSCLPSDQSKYLMKYECSLTLSH